MHLKHKQDFSHRNFVKGSARFIDTTVTELKLSEAQRFSFAKIKQSHYVMRHITRWTDIKVIELNLCEMQCLSSTRIIESH